MKIFARQSLFSFLILGMLLATAIVLVVTVKKHSGATERAMYFALHLDDGAVGCSLKQNVANTREAVFGMRNWDQLYSAILFADNAEATSLMHWEATISKLNTVQADMGNPPYSQISAVEEFITNRGENDVLVYFIPCQFNYRKSDRDLKNLIKAIKNAKLEDRILIISNDHRQRFVSELYQMKIENVVGLEDAEDVVNRIIEFVGRVHGFTTQRPVTSHNSAATKKTSTFTSSEGTRPYTGPITTKITESSPSSSDVVTSAKSTSQYTRTTRATGATKLSTRIPKTSPTAASTPAKTHDPTDDPRPDPTRAPTPAPTHDPGSVPTRASTPALSTAPVRTTARLTTKRPVKTSTKTSTSTTRTTRSTTRRSTTTMIWEPYTNIHCVFAADMLNMAKDEVAYEKEEDLIIKISEALFNSSIRPSAGLWIYGYTRVSRNWKYVFMNMKSAFNLFWEYVLARMRISDPAAITENKEVVAVTNKAFDLTRKATCLVFFSAVKNGTDFPLLKPRYPYKRVVAVSLQGADLSKSVSHLGQRGVAVNVPLYNFSRKDVSNVVESIRSAFS